MEILDFPEIRDLQEIRDLLEIQDPPPPPSSSSPHPPLPTPFPHPFPRFPGGRVVWIKCRPGGLDKVPPRWGPGTGGGGLPPPAALGLPEASGPQARGLPPPGFQVVETHLPPFPVLPGDWVLQG